MRPLALARAALRRIGIEIRRARTPQPITTVDVPSAIPAGAFKRIFQFFDRIHYMYETNSVREELRIASATRLHLLQHRRRQIQAIESGDAEGYGDLQRWMFFNELTTGIMNFHTHPLQLRHLRPEFLESASRFEFLSGVRLAEITTPNVLPSWGLAAPDGTVIKYTDPWHAEQAFNIHLLLERCADGPPERVVDLGSGYGGMAEKLIRIHRRPLDIWLVDIPLNLVIAYAFLSAQYYERCQLVTEPDEIERLDREPVAETRIICVPTVYAERLASHRRFLVNNARSLSEMDLSAIRYYLETLCNENCEYLLESNSNRKEHREVPNSEFPIPPTHKLVSRHYPSEQLAASGTMVTNLYQRHRR